MTNKDSTPVLPVIRVRHKPEKFFGILGPPWCRSCDAEGPDCTYNRLLDALERAVARVRELEAGLNNVETAALLGRQDLVLRHARLALARPEGGGE